MNGLWSVRRRSGLLLVMAVASSIPCLGRAESVVQAKVTEASLFKNGLGFVLRTAETTGPGEYVIENLPIPVHGTFWVLPASAETTVEEAVAFSRPRRESAQALTIPDLLKANVGKRVQIKVADEGWQAGTLVAVPEEEPKLPVPLSEAGARSGDSAYWRPPTAYRSPSLDAIRQAQSAGFVLLKTDEGMLAVQTADVRAVKGADGDFSLELTRPRPGAALRVKVKGRGGPLAIASLEWGLTWAPSYLIDISDAKQAVVRCKAEVIDDSEDLADATLQFVTGYPNVAFAEVVSPVAMLGDVTDFMQSLMAASRPRGERDNVPVLAQQAVMSNYASPFPSRPSWAPLPTEGEAREDLFLYPQPGVTLARGERGYYPVFTKQAPYESLFRWKIADSVDERGRWVWDWRYHEERGEQPEEVWHVLRLKNAEGNPWTTAPAMTVQEGRVIGQDTLFYTSPGAKTLVKVTRAVDIDAQVVEREVDRQVDALRRHGDPFDLITVKGELRVFSHKSKPVTLLIEKTLTGDVLQSNSEADVQTLTENVWMENPKRLLTWEQPLDAAGKAYITYQYKVYVRRS
jgi:hypothetical protein